MKLRGKGLRSHITTTCLWLVWAAKSSIRCFSNLTSCTLRKTAFAQEISRYLLNAAIHFDEVNARSHLQTEHVSAYAESIAASKSDISRASRYSSSSVVLEKRVQAVKANAALRLAEQEQLRKLEGEIKLLEIEKKHKELLRQQRIEMKEIERAKRLEMLRQQSERELAEARQRAAMMDLEAQLEEQMEYWIFQCLHYTKISHLMVNLVT